MKAIKTGLLAALLAFALGCGGSVSQSNFDQLKVGMKTDEVTKLLGKDSKEVDAAEIERLMAEVMKLPELPGATPDKSKDAPKAPEINISGMTGKRWGTDSKSITVIFLGDRVHRIFKNGL